VAIIDFKLLNKYFSVELFKFSYIRVDLIRPAYSIILLLLKLNQQLKTVSNYGESDV